MTTETALQTVTLKRDGHVLVMGLNRPDKRNAFDRAMLADLSRSRAGRVRISLTANLRICALELFRPQFALNSRGAAGLCRLGAKTAGEVRRVNRPAPMAAAIERRDLSRAASVPEC